MDRHIRGMAQVLCFVSWRRLVRRLPRWHELLAVALRAVLSSHVQVGVQVAASWENMKPLEGKHETRWENMKPQEGKHETHYSGRARGYAPCASVAATYPSAVESNRTSTYRMVRVNLSSFWFSSTD